MLFGLKRHHKRILLAIAEGATLKAHRDIDGNKRYVLHPLDQGEKIPVEWDHAERLRKRGYIYGNQKFPAATYLLTDKGRRAIKKWVDGNIKPLGARNFFTD